MKKYEPYGQTLIVKYIGINFKIILLILLLTFFSIVKPVLDII